MASDDNPMFQHPSFSGFNLGQKRVIVELTYRFDTTIDAVLAADLTWNEFFQQMFADPDISL